MNRLNRRDLLGLMGATALSGCAPALSTARLGDDPFEGGIGGTGIVGLMTGTGSVLVNGLRVELPPRTRIFANGLPVSDSALVAGVALSLVAQARSGRFEAQQIDIDAPLTGTAIRHGRGISINGTVVAVRDVTGLAGKRVVAHGIWQADGSVRASLLRPAPSGPDSVAGVVSGNVTQGWRIGQTRVHPVDGRVLVPGQFAVASGQFGAGVLKADRILPGRFRGGQALRQLSIEGYLEPVKSSPGYRIAGLGHSFERRLELGPFASLRAVYFGPYDGRFAARRAVVLPQQQAARQSLLRPRDGQNTAAVLTGPKAMPIKRK